MEEIALPSSLLNPPHVQAKPKPRKLTAKDYFYVCVNRPVLMKSLFHYVVSFLACFIMSLFFSFQCVAIGESVGL